MKKKTKIESINIGGTFSKEGKTYVIVSRDNSFTYASCTNGDGFRYIFVNGVELNNYGK